MSTVGRSLTTWEQFLELPDPEPGFHLELHDGEVVLVVPAAKPIDVLIQSTLVECLTTAAQGRGRAIQEFPYRPAKNLQFWYADVAYVPNEGLQAMRGDEYPIYSPPLIIEVLSPSNRRSKINAQRAAAFVSGTREFWVIDTLKRSVQVFYPNHQEKLYVASESVPVDVVPGYSLALATLFEGNVP